MSEKMMNFYNKTEMNRHLPKKRAHARRMTKIEKIKVKNNKARVNRKEKEKEVKKVKLLLDDILDFLAEMPVDKYHDYREFRNLRLRGQLINKFMQERYVQQIRRIETNN
jgi:hypothetical protein